VLPIRTLFELNTLIEGFRKSGVALRPAEVLPM